MKNITDKVLGILFLISFLKSFKYSSNSYDIVFIIMITITYISNRYIKEKNSKDELDKLTSTIDTKLNLQNEEIERIKNNTSKMAVANGLRR
jgi:hypothetical protein